MIQKAHRYFVQTKLRLVVGNKIQDLFTSIQGFFSPFLHSTFSISVSPKYLALDEIYHPLGLQSRTTRLIDNPTPIETT